MSRVVLPIGLISISSALQRLRASRVRRLPDAAAVAFKLLPTTLGTIAGPRHIAGHNRDVS